MIFKILLEENMNSIIKMYNIIILFGVNLIISLLFPAIIYLNEEQILNSMSTLAQIVAGLFGLVLAAYAIIDPNLKDLGNKDKQSSDYVNILRDRYFKNIIILAIMCAITIISSLLTINLYSTVNSKLISALLNQTSIFGVFSIILSLYFGCSLLNPNSLKNLSIEEKKEIEEDYDSNLSDSDFKPFVLYYNKLESLILKFATELLDDKDLDEVINYKLQGRMQLLQALSILNMREIINKNIYEKIDELRRYRNALVHNPDDQKVDAKIFNELKEIYNKLSEVYNAKDDQLRAEAIYNLYRIGSNLYLNQTDLRIIDIININDGISAKEIAQKLNINVASIYRNLKRLVNMEKIIYKNYRYYIN